MMKNTKKTFLRLSSLLPSFFPSPYEFRSVVYGITLSPLTSFVQSARITELQNYSYIKTFLALFWRRGRFVRPYYIIIYILLYNMRYILNIFVFFLPKLLIVICNSVIL